MKPIAVTAAEISRNFGFWQDRTSEGPLIVTHHGRPRIAVLAIDTYETLTQVPAPAGETMNDHAKLAVLAEHVSGCFAAFDRDLRFVYVNAEASVHFGRSQDALMGRALAELYPGTRDGIGISTLRRVAAGGDAVELDMPSQIHANRLMRTRIFPYPGGVATIFSNVAHEAKIQRGAHEQAALLAVSDVHGQIASTRLSLRGTIDRDDVTLARVTGLPPERLRGARLTDLLVTRERGAAADQVEAVLGRGEKVTFRSTLLTNGGAQLPVCIGIAPIDEGFRISGAIALLTVIG